MLAYHAALAAWHPVTSIDALDGQQESPRVGSCRGLRRRWRCWAQRLGSTTTAAREWTGCLWITPHTRGPAAFMQMHSACTATTRWESSQSSSVVWASTWSVQLGYATGSICAWQPPCTLVHGGWLMPVQCYLCCLCPTPCAFTNCLQRGMSGVPAVPVHAALPGRP